VNASIWRTRGTERSTRNSCYIGFKVYLVPTVRLLLLLLLLVILLLLRSWRRTIRVILAPIGIHRRSLLPSILPLPAVRSCTISDQGSPRLSR